MKKQTDAPKIEALPYAEAYAELQQILSALQAEQVDIDQLATQIERANELIRICRERLRTAESKLG
jgi:exodeoxyribonuclease VII small subunit